MPTNSFAADLELYGPQGKSLGTLTPGRARAYCRRLARGHYENFTVVSWLLPRGLRQHFYNIYAYCRWSDDLADEVGNPGRSLALLNWWEQQLQQCYQGTAVHPVFLALSDTIREFAIPPDPFADLLVAFRQDQQVTRYETLDQLLEYCRYSANPVGRLILYLGRCHTPDRVRLSDSVCTGLQLANFWQDVARDHDRGRIYLPQTHCRRFGVDETVLQRREPTEGFRRLLAAEVADADGLLRRGLPLVSLVPRPLQLDVSLFIHGGLAILEAIRRQDHDVLSRRPVLSRREKIALAVQCWWRLLKSSRHSPSAVRQGPRTD